MKKAVGLEKNTCISTCESTCEKSINETNKIKLQVEAKSVINSSYNQQISLNDSFSAREINLENILIRNHKKFETSRILKGLLSGELKTFDYLRLIESHINDEMISYQNYNEIKNLGFELNGNLTSFFGFETRLINPDARSDYLIAISSLNGEREALVNFIQKGNLSKNLLDRPEWQQLYKFALNWVNPKSEIYNNVLGLWLEFDTANSLDQVLVPSIFLQTVPIRIDSPEDIENCRWITRKVMPYLQGKPVPKKVEKFL
jgi:hypothetical protein